MRRDNCYLHLVLLAALSLLSLPSLARPLDLAMVKDKTIGILLATFDPPTIYHDHLIEEAFAQQKFDELLVIPSDFTPHKWFRSSTTIRHKMLSAAYRDSPKVLTIEPYRYGYPQSRGVIAALKKAGAQVVGVSLAEDLKGWANKKVIAWMLPCEERLIIPESDRFPAGSSALVRNYLKSHPQFYAKDTPFASSEEELLLSEPVRRVIHETKLYHKGWMVGGFAYDFLYTSTARIVAPLALLPTLFGKKRSD
jgi:nicotinic acid mononucleotide adenylyltransferase